MRLGDLDALMAKFLDGEADTAAEKEMNQVCRYLIRHTPTIDAVPVAQLREMLSKLESKCCGDGAETYTTGYRNGHRNGQIELLRYILQVPDGTSEDTRKDGGKE